jgi:tetratricopeptide (TPR) repeat protein
MQRINPALKRITARIVWYILIFPALVLPATNAVHAEAQISLSAGRQFEYANACFEQKDYAAASAEFKRFIFFFPDDARVDRAVFHIGLSALHAGDYEDALSRFQGIHEKLGFIGLGMSAVLQAARTRALMGDSTGAADFLHDRIQAARDPGDAAVLNYHLAWLYVETGQFARAGLNFDAIDPDETSFQQIPEIKALLNEYPSIPSKSPAAAVLLSIVPGGGYLYCGRYQDAFISLVLNGLMAWAAVESFEEDQHGLGGLITVLGAGFYAGSIYGATTAAHKYTQRQQQAFARDLKNRFSVHLFPGPHGDPGAAWSVQYRF